MEDSEPSSPPIVAHPKLNELDDKTLRESLDERQEGYCPIHGKLWLLVLGPC